MSASRLLGVAVALPLLLAGAPPAAAAGSDTAQDPAPVQILPLTTPAGGATELARGGLDGAGSGEAAEPGGAGEPGGVSEPAEPAEPASGSEQGGAWAGTSAGTAVSPALRALLPTAVGAAVDPQEDAVLLTDPVEVDEFLVAGFTWSGQEGLAEGTQIYLRVRENGTWSPWYLNEVSDGGPDEASFNGTSELITGGAQAIQASVVGSAESLPADLRLALVPGRPQGEEVLEVSELPTATATPTAVATQDAGPVGPPAPSGTTAPTAPSAQEPATDEPQPAGAPTAPGTAGAPAGTSGGMGIHPGLASIVSANATGDIPVPVTTRDQWGANASYMTWNPSYATASHVVVHHTAGTNNYTASQSASIVRGIYHYHAVTLDWGDVGYNFLIDKYGQVFEGRYGSTRAAAGTMVVGAHARGANTGTMGLSMMGDYSSVAPSSTQLDAVGRMAGWFLNRAGVSDAHGAAGFTIRTTEKYRAGSTVSLPRILGHRDVGYTACPGNAGYSRMGEIRSIAQSQMSDGSRWARSGGSWYHYGAGGATTTGWLAYRGAWYYLSPNGGAMATGWNRIGGSWYYLDPSSGAMATGWRKVGGAWYYLNPNGGAMATGWNRINGFWYYLEPSSGAMATGWRKVGGSWYFLHASGAMATGWTRIGDTWFYMDPSSGAIATGWNRIGGSWYYLEPSSGAMATGWRKVGGSWYFLHASGAMATGWVRIGGSWYYLDPSSGVMATGSTRIGGTVHGFAPSGVWTGEVSAKEDGWSLQDATYTHYRGGVATASQPLRSILAPPTASRSQVISTMTSAYAGSGRTYPAAALGRGGAPNAHAFFTMVYDEAVAEGVSPELLFAQVVKETGWLQFGGDVRVGQFNFGGLGATGGGVAGNSFPSVRVGLRAQAQHLRAYADPSVTAASLANPVVDPRFQYVRKGSAPYIQYLGIKENPHGGGWAASRYYGIELVQLMDQYFG